MPNNAIIIFDTKIKGGERDSDVDDFSGISIADWRSPLSLTYLNYIALNDGCQCYLDEDRNALYRLDSIVSLHL
jgi:hypothetical protein